MQSSASQQKQQQPQQQQPQQQPQQQQWVAQQGPQQWWQPAAPWMQSPELEPERQEPRIRLRTSAAVEELAALQRRRRTQEELKGSSICSSLLLQQQQQQPQLQQQQQQPPPSQTMMRSSAAAAVAPILPTWQREHDMPHRRVLIQHIVRILNGRSPSTSAAPEHAQLVPDVAKTLEATLYREAPSLEAYTCRATLVDRLKRIAAANQANDFAIMRSTMTGGRTNSISSSSTTSSTGLDQPPPPGAPPVPAQHQHESFQPPQLQHQQQGRRPSWSISGGSGVPNHGGGSNQQQQHHARRGNEQSNQQKQQLPPVVASAVPPPLLSQPGDQQQQSPRSRPAMSTTMRKDDNSTSVRGDFSSPQPGLSFAAPAPLPPLNSPTTLPPSHVHVPQYLSTGSSSAGADVTTATTISLRTSAGPNKDMRPSLLQESLEMAEPVSVNQAATPTTTAANNADNNDAVVGEAPTTTATPGTPAAAADSVMPSICCICLQSVLSGSESVGATSCGHCYHTDCFETKKAKLFHPLYRDMLAVRENEEDHEDDNDEYDGDDDDNNNDEETTDTELEEEGRHKPDDTDGRAHGPESKCRDNDGDNIAVGGGAKRKRGEEERTGSTTDVEGDSKLHAVADPMDEAAAAPPGKKQQAPSSPNESLDVSAPAVKLAKYKSLVRRQSEAIAALKQQVVRLKRGERDQQSTNDQLKRRMGRKEMEIKRLVGINDTIVLRLTRAELSLRSNLVHIAAIKEKMEQDLLLLQKQT